MQRRVAFVKLNPHQEVDFALRSSGWWKRESHPLSGGSQMWWHVSRLPLVFNPTSWWMTTMLIWALLSGVRIIQVSTIFFSYAHFTVFFNLNHFTVSLSCNESGNFTFLFYYSPKSVCRHHLLKRNKAKFNNKSLSFKK